MKNMGIKNKKVAVAISGGVDSSVAMALLKKQGYSVIGVFMKFWRQDKNSGQNKCCCDESEKMARMVCENLGVPFYILNAEKEFKKTVVDYFLSEYKKGSTPNPCVVCNKEIKFGIFIQKALKMGADYIATGHYAKIKYNKSKKEYRLYKGKDKEKDQSYFLWKLNQKQLSMVLFPVGIYTKTEVRKIAKRFKLPVADRPESQEVCFVNKTVNDFLSDYLRPKPGKIVGIKGKISGEHEGLCFYTIGQRKGIKLQQGPYYVVSKNPRNNYLVVSKNRKDLLKKGLIARDASWISKGKQNHPFNVAAKIRYRSKLSQAKIYKLNKNKLKVVFDKPQVAITSGQSIVFYKGEELIGGAIIE